MLRILFVFVIAMSAMPFAFSESQSFVQLSNSEISLPESSVGAVPLTISGIVDGYDRGKYIHLELSGPNDYSEKFTTFGSEKGEIFTIIEFDRTYEPGKYEITVTYRGDSLTASFNLV